MRERGTQLIEGLERHLPGSLEHAEASGSDAFAAAVELGHDRSRSELIREAARLHEIGKAYVPTEVLARSPSERTPKERSQLDDHHEAGYRLARGAGVPEQVCGWILRFRERFDGRGPESLAAGAIPIESRTARGACACDRALRDPALKSAGATVGGHRVSAISGLRGQAGHQLDPSVVDALSAVLERAASTVD